MLDTLGPRAGNLMSSKRLGNVVRKMKLKKLNIAYPSPPDCEIAKRRKLVRSILMNIFPYITYI